MNKQKHYQNFDNFMQMFRDELDIETPRGGEYHKEGNVLFHTLMVYQSAVITGNDFLKIVALAHDTGKRKAMKEIDGRTRFTGHEGISTINFLTYLREHREDLSRFSEDEIIMIIYMINYHGIFWQKSKKQIEQNFAGEEDLFELLQDFSHCDWNGNICEKDYQMSDYELNDPQSNICDDNAPVIYMMVGLPGSGKDTFIKNNFPNIPILSRDDILMDYHEEHYYMTDDYSEAWKNLTKEDQTEIDRLLQKRYTSLSRSGEDFIVNMTNLSWKTRRKWFSNKHRIRIYTFLISFDELERRNTGRGGKTLNMKLITSMCERYELPLFGEHPNIELIDYIFDDD